MTVKIDKNIVAVVTGFIIVISFCLVELLLPSTGKNVQTAAQTNGELKLPVLMYHHILKNEARLGDYVISPAQLESDFKYITEHGYTSISSEELLSYVNGGTLPEKCVMITFDDGYESVYEYAFPLLKKYKLKATVSIIGKHTDIFSNPNEPNNVNYGHLSWDQLREMQKSGFVEIENHTYDMHENAGKSRYGIRIKKGESTESYKAALTKDIGGLTKQIKEEIGVTPITFAYPFGAICKESKPILTELGFKVILTCEEKINIINQGTEEPIILKRFNRAHKYSTYQFFNKLGFES